MRTLVALMSTACLFLVSVGGVLAQTAPTTPATELVGKSTTAVGYVVGGGATKVDLKATSAGSHAAGEAKVEARQGVTNIEVKVEGLAQPTTLGAELLTYVLWVVSSEGRTGNVGELLINHKGEGELKTTSQLQTFSLIVTAEPYFAVRQPSEVVVLENAVRKDTKGRQFPISDYKLMRRAQYQKMGNPLALSLDLKKVPLELYEARNAVEIARSRGAERYAPEVFTKAAGGLQLAENALARKEDKKKVISTARSTVQSAEDARALAVQRQDEERVVMERDAAAAKAKAAAEAKAAADAAVAKQQADAEARRQAEVAAAREAQMKAEAAAAKQRADEAAKRQARVTTAREAQMKAEAEAAKQRADAEARRQAEVAAAREAQMKAEAEAAAVKAKADADAAAATAKADAEALKAKEEAAKADAARARQAAEQLRAQLLDQLNRVLETRDTPRGLVVTMADVLFATGKYDLAQTAREKLARLSGIVLAHPGLKLEIEGYTDSTGSDALNQTLSEQRAGAVRSYLMEQGLAGDSVAAKGFGKTMPVADNNTAAGRQKNRRVEIIVSGEAIGSKIGK